MVSATGQLTLSNFRKEMREDREPKAIKDEHLFSSGSRETTPEDQVALNNILESLIRQGYESPFYVWPEDTVVGDTPVFVITDRNGNKITCDRKTGEIMCVKSKEDE